MSIGANQFVSVSVNHILGVVQLAAFLVSIGLDGLQLLLGGQFLGQGRLEFAADFFDLLVQVLGLPFQGKS